MENLKIGTQEWLEARRKYITATDTPIIMKASPWCTPLELYHKKINGTESEQTAAMKRGLDLEDEARKLFEAKLGCSVSPEFRMSEEYPWMAASFDGFSEAEEIVVEIKCPGQKDHELALEGKIPEYYLWQLHHQMIVADVFWVYYVSYRPDHEQHFCMIKVQEDLYKRSLIIGQSKIFWDNLNARIPPDPIERDLNKLLNKDPKRVIDFHFLAKERRLASLLAASKELEEQIEELKQQLIELCDGESSLGSLFKFSQSIYKGTVDYSKIEELKSIDLEKYRRPSRLTWSVRPIDDKS